MISSCSISLHFSIDVCDRAKGQLLVLDVFDVELIPQRNGAKLVTDFTLQKEEYL